MQGLYDQKYSRVFDEARMLRAIGSRAINQSIWECALPTAAVKGAIHIWEVWIGSRAINYKEAHEKTKNAVREHFQELKKN